MKPILFSTEMVKTILDGRKTQTRRVIKFAGGCTGRSPMMDVTDPNRALIFSPTGIKRSPYSIGDVLWVRETWTCIRDIDSGHEDYFFAANKLDYDTVSTTRLCDDDGFETGKPFPWKPSIYMPKKLARLFLRVTNVRAERVQDISTSDCEEEGIASDIDRFNGMMTPHHDWIVGEYQKLWDSLNAKRGYGWDSNPWVWVISFKQTEKPEVEE